MAALSPRLAQTAPYRQPDSNSSNHNDLQQHAALHGIRNFSDIRLDDGVSSRRSGIAAGGGDINTTHARSVLDHDDGDAYSIEARSDASHGNNDAKLAQPRQHQQHQQRAPSHPTSDEVVRPDSLALTSPLEQLKRNLSFNRGDAKSGSPSISGAAAYPSSRPLMERQASLPAMIHALEQEENLAMPLPFSQASGRLEPSSSQAFADSQEKAEGNQGKKDYSPMIPASGRPFERELNHGGHFGQDRDTYLEPVRFSNESLRVGNDSGVGDSDAQSQLISAFRNSYHTTRDGGIRDSSYSWMGADQESPNVTMDFKQAQAVYRAADHGQLGNEAGEEDEEAFKDPEVDDDNDDDHDHNQQQYIFNSSNDNSNEHEIEDLPGWEPEGRIRARASSWDSQEAERMGLHRIPSQKKSKDAEGGRQSGMSGFDPFAYSSYESLSRKAARNPTAFQDPTRASVWTSLTEESGDNTGYQAQALSTSKAIPQTPNMFVYPVDSAPIPVPGDKYQQGRQSSPQTHSFDSSSQATDAGGVSRARSQVSRTNFSRPHDPSYTADSSATLQPPSQQLGGMQRAASDSGYPHPSRQDYESMYSAYGASSSKYDSRYEAPPAPPFQGAWSTGYSPPPSSTQNSYSIQDTNSPMRPDMQSLGSFQSSTNQGHLAPRAVPTAKHRRTPSQVLASAIAKHRAQRSAAGLTTDGQYYVDPKTKKYYFVASSGQAGGVALAKSKENKDADKGKERRKLYKKEAGWEVSQVNQSKNVSGSAPPQTPELYQRARSLSQSGNGSNSGQASEDAGSGGKRWKLFGGSTSRKNGSQENTPQTSPNQPHIAVNRNISHHPMRDPDEYQQEYIVDPHPPSNFTMMTPPLPYQSAFDTVQPGRSQQNESQNDDFGSPSLPYIAAASEATQGGRPAPNESTRRQQRSRSNTPQLLVPRGGPPSSGGHGDRPGQLDRSGSVYSNYSYYEMPSDQSRIASPAASPITAHPPFESRYERAQRTPSPSHTPVPLASPYMPPTAPEFQPNGHVRQPSTTLDKAKTSIQRSGSLQMLAVSKHQNLTVPKGSSHKQQDLLDLAQTDPNDPLVCLHRGIDAHERGELEESAHLFQRSADGGCGLGMLMYGLALRHGWGCDSQPERGFQYLQKAAESVVQNLDRVIAGQVQLSEQQLEEQSAKSELVLSIYELGQCFLRGWGVAKNKKTALEYFTLAANLGDPDAQSELGFCYSTGRGCKKDLKQAAKYYRMAAKQGQISYGMQWIFKSKYDD